MATIESRITDTRTLYASGVTRSLDWRNRQLDSLFKLLRECRNDICIALEKDLGRMDHFTSQFYELNSVEQEISFLKKNLKKLTEPCSVNVSIANQPAHAHVQAEPLGTVLIMSAWNFPILTLLQPAAGAIAAGNCVILKPSNISAHTSACISQLIERYFPNKEIICIEGGVEESTRVLESKFEKIMYTGGSSVAKIVMTAAAKNLTPVDLKLGGKNPCIVTGNIETDNQLLIAAKRIVWGKFAVNAGQVCIAPDYVMVHEAVASEFRNGMKKCLAEFFGNDIKASFVYSRIINSGHMKRLESILEGDRKYLSIGGEVDDVAKYISPTVLDFGNDMKAFMESKAMTCGEIFGPILPIVTYSGDLTKCIEFINKGEKPLSMYLFGLNEEGKEIAAKTSSGSLTVNDCVMQKAELGLPFGGVGMSGTGRYNGKYSFETFSHYKPVLFKKLKMDLDARYPPYDDKKKKLFETVHAVMLGERSGLALAYGMLKYQAKK